jgi:hypothetical protein
MSASARAAAVAAFFALLLLGLLTGDDPRDFTQTSFGKLPFAYGAVFDLLRELGLPVARSFAGPDALSAGATVWWIEPNGLVKSAPPPDAESHPQPPSPLAGAPLAGFVERGGTAVVLLPVGLDGAASAVETVAGLAVPARHVIASPHGADAEEGTPTGAQVEPGPIASRARSLVVDAPVVFDADDGALGDWRVAAKLGGEPFVLERAVGDGRLVLGADPRFLSNQWLDRGDAALLAVDLVRAYGTPHIDERAHGITAQRGTLAYLARSPAAPFFAALALVGLVLAWNGAALPRRTLVDADPDAPTLESFVASLARLYAATGDHARVLARARELAARRLRRHFGLPPDAPVDRLLERLARTRRLPAPGLDVLSRGAPVRDAAGLERAVAALDQLVEEAVS